MHAFTRFSLAKDFNFDTMHPLYGQGVHFWLPKAIVFLSVIHIINCSVSF